MFGALRIHRHRLSAAGRRAYRAAFCTSCHALRELGGRPASLLTNYDQTVLAVALAGLSRRDDGAEPARHAAACTALPWRTVMVDELSAPARALLAALDVATVTAKLRDDIDDERSWRARAGLRLLRPLDDRARTALRGLGFPLSLFDELPERQRRVERDPTATIEDLAAPTAELTGQLFAHAALVTRRARLAPTLARLGAALGRYVYGLDAWQDRRRDVRRGEFNGWQQVHGDLVDGPTVADWLGAALDDARQALRALPDQEFRAVLEALVDSAAARLGPIARTGSRSAPRGLREAGDCDISCCCGDSCCDGGPSCCSGGSCGPVGNAAEAGSSVCCDCCSFCPCCDGDDEARNRKRRRRRQPAFDPADFDLSEPNGLVGLTVVAVTDLAPCGRVELAGAQFDARCERTLAAAGEALIVFRVERGILVVGRPGSSVG